MATLNIVLVEPQIPQNTGNIARTCAATGARLHLVGPMGFAVDDARLRRAGLDYWPLLDITHYESLPAFFGQNTGPYFFFTTKARRAHSETGYPDGSCLVFGREDAGLPEPLLLERSADCLRIPILAEARSLNLSNSVAVAVFEALRQWGYPGLSGEGRLRGYEWKD